MLPKLYRFRNLKERNIVQSWPALKDLIDNEDFPPGRKLSPNIRAWTEDEVIEWLDSRPTEPSTSLRGAVARIAAEKAASRTDPEQTDAA
jgi:hypothetical protein